MRVLMLGWEFPPYIAGGLGTACFGLTRALNARGTDVLFVLPKPIHGGKAGRVALAGAKYDHSESHLAPAQRQTIDLPPTPATVEQVLEDSRQGWDPSRPPPPSSGANNPGTAGHGAAQGGAKVEYHQEGLAHVTFRTVDVLLKPYLSDGEYKAWRAAEAQACTTSMKTQPVAAPKNPGAQVVASVGVAPVTKAPVKTEKGEGNYAGDLITETQRYAELAGAIAREQEFDVVHAHDWMTFPAGLAVAQQTGKPLVVHIHSTEYDRNGISPNADILEIEAAGLAGATRIIAVSQLTKRLLVAKYGIAEERIEVVHNAIDLPEPSKKKGTTPGIETIKKDEKVVLFLGRITAQKGPEYFLAAAQKVLGVYPKVKFIMAGAGDLLEPTVELAAQMGIGHKVLFAGFLTGKDVQKAYQMADVFVMSSVSEPFGIAPLEALANNVPVIISKQSGVAEVLEHALKVDFWDTDELANKILAVLRHPVLAKTLKKNAKVEIEKRSWLDAADEVIGVYQNLVTVAAS